MKSEKCSIFEKMAIFPKIGYCSAKRTKNECFLTKSGHLIKIAISSQKKKFLKKRCKTKRSIFVQKMDISPKNTFLKQFNQPDQFLAFTPKLVQTDFQSILCFLRNEFI